MTGTALLQMLIAQTNAPGPLGLLETLTPWLLVIGIFYFLIIRPQQKRTKEHQQMLDELKRDQEVVTSGGLFGKITGLTDAVVTLEIAQNVRVKVQRSQVAGLRTRDAVKKDSGKKK